MNEDSQLFSREMLTRNSLQEQVGFHIEEMITSGQLQVGDRLPSEIEMARQFDVHRSTVREALRVLTKIGLTARLTGNGSVTRQVPAPGTPIEPGMTCDLRLERTPTAVSAFAGEP